MPDHDLPLVSIRYTLFQPGALPGRNDPLGVEAGLSAH